MSYQRRRISNVYPFNYVYYNTGVGERTEYENRIAHMEHTIGGYELLVNKMQKKLDTLVAERAIYMKPGFCDPVVQARVDLLEAELATCKKTDATSTAAALEAKEEIASLQRDLEMRDTIVQALEDRIDNLEERDPSSVSGLLDPLDSGACDCQVAEESAKAIADLAETEERLTKENALLVATVTQLRATGKQLREESKKKDKDIATLSRRLGYCREFITTMLERETAARQRRVDDFLTEMHGSRSDVEAMSSMLSSIWGEEGSSNST